jgi:hypothetical protein
MYSSRNFVNSLGGCAGTGFFFVLRCAATLNDPSMATINTHTQNLFRVRLLIFYVLFVPLCG